MVPFSLIGGILGPESHAPRHSTAHAAPQPREQHFSRAPEAWRVRCACTPSAALLRQGLNCTLLAVPLKATSTQGTHSAEPLLAAFAQMEDVHRNTPLANIQISGFGRYIPAWCRRDMSHYLANLCLHCILQVGITTGLYPEARVSICMNLSQQTLLFLGETNYP